MSIYCVSIPCKYQENFVVEASSKEEAKANAQEMFDQGISGELIYECLLEKGSTDTWLVTKVE